jgi:hypothetical protein
MPRNESLQIDVSNRQRLTTRSVQLAVYALLVSVAWVVNFPGRLNPDSVDMLTQVHINDYDDWHAPVVTYIWSLFELAMRQPSAALLVQSLLMFIYPVIVITGDYPKRSRLVTIALFAGWAIFLAALIAVTGQIVKDTVLVALVLCLLAALEGSSSPIPVKTRWPVLAVLLALIFLVRPTNFFMLAIAGAIWTFFAVEERWRRIKVASVITAVCAASLVLSPVVNRGLLGAQNAMTERSLIIFDVAGISTHLKQDLFAELPNWPGDKLAKPWECYTATNWDPFRWGACAGYSKSVESIMKKDGTAFVVRWWLKSIATHPIAYLQHRLAYSYAMLRHMNPVESRGEPYAVNTPPRINELFGSFSRGVDMRDYFELWNPVTAYIPFGLAAALVFSRPVAGLAFILCGLLLLWAWHSGRRGPATDNVVVVSSAIGIANIATLMVFGIASEGRYLILTVVCAAVALWRMTRAGAGEKPDPVEPNRSVIRSSPRKRGSRAANTGFPLSRE